MLLERDIEALALLAVPHLPLALKAALCAGVLCCVKQPFFILHSEHIILKRRETKYPGSAEKRWGESQYQENKTDVLFSPCKHL